MMKRLSTAERREYILSILKSSKEAVTGNQLSELTHVSRQIIVKDISFLKANNETIIATSQGYLYLPSQTMQPSYEKMIVCNHHPDQTAIELYTLVDHEITVKDIIVEHPIYGELKAILMLSTRNDVKNFLEKVASSKAGYLSQLTGGIHIHTVQANSLEQLNLAIKKLKDKSIIVSEK